MISRQRITCQKTYFIFSQVNIDRVPPPLKTTVINTITKTVVSIISLGKDEVLRIAKANATAPRRPRKGKQLRQNNL